MVVEESVIEFWDGQYSSQPCNLRNRNCGGMDLTLLGGWHRAQQSHAIGLRIGEAVVEESDIELEDHQGTYKDNHYNGQQFQGLRCDRDTLYTSAELASRLTTFRNQV